MAQGRKSWRAQGAFVPARLISTRFVAALPKTVKAIAVLDRTKEPGSSGEPLYLDCVDGAVRGRRRRAQLSKCRWSSADVTGCRRRNSRRRWSRRVFDNLAPAEAQEPFHHRHQRRCYRAPSLAYDPAFSTEPKDVVRAVFYGLGSDGTVGANKDSIKIIGEDTRRTTRRAISCTTRRSPARRRCRTCVSGREPIRSTYLVSQANFVACHQPSFLERYDILQDAVAGRHVPAEHALQRGGSLDQAAAADAEAHR